MFLEKVNGLRLESWGIYNENFGYFSNVCILIEQILWVLMDLCTKIGIYVYKKYKLCKIMW